MADASLEMRSRVGNMYIMTNQMQQVFATAGSLVLTHPIVFLPSMSGRNRNSPTAFTAIALIPAESSNITCNPAQARHIVSVESKR